MGLILLKELARAKINLFLHVTGKRSDGYHLLESLVFFADFGDDVTFYQYTKPTLCANATASGYAFALEVTGEFASAISGSNIAEKAAELFYNEFPHTPKCKIIISKNLPVSSGIGGGSADAAAVLRGLAKLSGINIENENISKIALSIGADVPMCVYSKPLIVRGIGDEITEVREIPEFGLLLVNPLVQVSTKDVFAGISTNHYLSSIDIPNSYESLSDLLSFLNGTTNSLTQSAVSISPEIDELIRFLKAQNQTLFASMSGSGATCFAITNPSNQKELENLVRKRFPEYWVFS